jgi:hypothetical protein
MVAFVIMALCVVVGLLAAAFSLRGWDSSDDPIVEMALRDREREKRLEDEQPTPPPFI